MDVQQFGWIGLAAMVGYVVGRLWPRARYDRWLLERRVDALLKHHGIFCELKLPDEVELELRAGRKSEAVRLYRAQTGAGLYDAYQTITGKNTLERKVATMLAYWKVQSDTRLPTDVQSLVDQGKQMEAIKLLRKTTGFNLTMAKKAVARGEVPV